MNIKEPPRCVKLDTASNLAIVRFKVQGKNHTQKEIKNLDSCVKVYTWIWTLCTQANQDKLKTVPGFAENKAMKDFIKLNVAINVITPSTNPTMIS